MLGGITELSKVVWTIKLKEFMNIQVGNWAPTMHKHKIISTDVHVMLSKMSKFAASSGLIIRKTSVLNSVP